MIDAVAVGVAADQDHRLAEVRRMREQRLPDLSIAAGRAAPCVFGVHSRRAAQIVIAAGIGWTDERIRIDVPIICPETA